MFGSDASVADTLLGLSRQHQNAFINHSVNICDGSALEKIFSEYGSDISAIIHTAAQPSHDWAASNPRLDLDVNLLGTSNLLESYREYCPDAVFIHCSTNKVYGDRPNSFDYEKKKTRFEPKKSEDFFARGFNETLSIDQSTHSLFGASKLAADILVQEYGKYFGLKTGCFRGGCLTGARHKGAKLHGFLSYLVRSCIKTREFSVIGYDGLQVRDNIDADDVIKAFDLFRKSPKPGEVYNLGGGRKNSISVVEALNLCEEIFSIKIQRKFVATPRIGDHIWWISDMTKFQSDYPTFKIEKSLSDIFAEIGDTTFAGK